MITARFRVPPSIPVSNLNNPQRQILKKGIKKNTEKKLYIETKDSPIEVFPWKQKTFHCLQSAD